MSTTPMKGEMPELADDIFSMDIDIDAIDIDIDVEDILANLPPPTVDNTSRYHPRPHPLPPRSHLPPTTTMTVAAQAKKQGKRRGSYNCGKCGLPKKGHVCPDNADANANANANADADHNVPHYASSPVSPSFTDRINRSYPGKQPYLHESYTHNGVKRSLDMMMGDVSSPPLDRHLNANKSNKKKKNNDGSSTSLTSSYDPNGGLFNEDVLQLDCVDSEFPIQNTQEGGIHKLNESEMIEILRRLPPPLLLVAGKVCVKWRKCAGDVWSAVTESRLEVSAQIGRMITILKKCSNIKCLTLHVSRVIDDALLKTVSQAVPYLMSLDIQCTSEGINNVTGEGLKCAISTFKSLRSLKIDKCFHIYWIEICSNHLSTLWLHDCPSITNMVLNCPFLSELSLTFLAESMPPILSDIIEKLGESCTELSKIHIASDEITHSEVVALAAAKFRLLRAVSILFGSHISDASVATLASNYNYLETLDLSGSSITDKGLSIICDAYSQSLTRLLICSCPNITIAGVQMVTRELPYLQLLDCGKTIAVTNVKADPTANASETEGQHQHSEHSIDNKLVIIHQRLQKLSLWGCSGIDGLYLECPELADLNLNSCSNIGSEDLVLLCPSLKSLHLSACNEDLMQMIRKKTTSLTEKKISGILTKRMADGSKRILAPCDGILEEACEDFEEGKILV